jgi:hypothetical protein
MFSDTAIKLTFNVPQSGGDSMARFPPLTPQAFACGMSNPAISRSIMTRVLGVFEEMSSEERELLF